MQSTRIGIIVNNLRKQRLERLGGEGDLIVQRLARLMDVWKARLKRLEPAPTTGQMKRTAQEEDTSVKNPKIQKVSNAKEERATSAPASASSMPMYERLGDETRNKCIEMFFNALNQDLKTNPEHVMNIAVEIEQQLHSHCKGRTDSEYKSTFRSKYLNLKDKQNPELRESLLYGAIPAPRFVQMTPAEMASDARKKECEKINAQNLLNAQLAKDTQAETDQFKCGKCQQRKCKYYQLQIRSADEPMTTFVTCVNCGNRWKFC